MFWVFCCSCFARPSQAAQRKFYMSSCSHIYCERCINHSHPYCRRCCVSIRVIACDSQMPSEVRSVFCDANEKVANLIKALEYQAGQRFGLMSHLRGSEQKYNSAKAYIRDAEIKYSNMKQKLDSSLRKIKELELANETLKKQVQKMRQVTPSPSPPSDAGQWFTHMSFPTPQSRKSVMNTPSAPFTPRNCYTQYRNTPTPAVTPPFVTSKTPPLHDTCGSRYSVNRNVPGFTPPQKTMELLTILNKKRELNLS
uniref:RING-type domain-containing protein n=2 Tax=Lygus hesperus TaxID=30085 RepID=A0A0A9WJE9_LYGHE